MITSNKIIDKTSVGFRFSTSSVDEFSWFVQCEKAGDVHASDRNGRWPAGNSLESASEHLIRSLPGNHPKGARVFSSCGNEFGLETQVPKMIGLKFRFSVTGSLQMLG